MSCVPSMKTHPKYANASVGPEVVVAQHEVVVNCWIIITSTAAGHSHPKWFYEYANQMTRDNSAMVSCNQSSLLAIKVSDCKTMPAYACFSTASKTDRQSSKAGRGARILQYTRRPRSGRIKHKMHAASRLQKHKFRPCGTQYSSLYSSDGASARKNQVLLAHSTVFTYRTGSSRYSSCVRCNQQRIRTDADIHCQLFFVQQEGDHAAYLHHKWLPSITSLPKN